MTYYTKRKADFSSETMQTEDNGMTYLKWCDKGKIKTSSGHWKWRIHQQKSFCIARNVRGSYSVRIKIPEAVSYYLKVGYDKLWIYIVNLRTITTATRKQNS